MNVVKTIFITCLIFLLACGGETAKNASSGGSEEADEKAATSLDTKVRKLLMSKKFDVKGMNKSYAYYSKTLPQSI